MQRWFRQAVGSVFRGATLFAGTAAGVAAIAVGLAVTGAGVILLMGEPSTDAMAGAGAIALATLPGALGLATLASLFVSWWLPARRVVALREVARMFGLRIALEPPGRFVAVGTYAGRGVRIESLPLWWYLTHRITVAVECRAKGHGAFVGRGSTQAPRLEGQDPAWLERIVSTPLASEALDTLVKRDAVAGCSVLVLPTQLHATGHLGWLADEGALQACVQAMIDLAEATERCPPPSVDGKGGLLRVMGKVLPVPGDSTPLLDLLSMTRAVSMGFLASVSALWLVACPALVLIAAAG